MPLDYVRLKIVRLVSVVTATGGLSAPLESELAGSPFLARVYRAAQSSVLRDEAQAGTATLDEMRRVSILNPACPAEVGDIAYLPRPDGTTTRAKIMRPRRYTDRVQYDLETGAEGDGSTISAAGNPLPPSASAQSQIDALTLQIGILQMSFTNAFKYTGKKTLVTLSATATLTKPTVPTDYVVDCTAAPVVVTLWPSTGDGTDYRFYKSAGAAANTASFALNAGDTSITTLANAVLTNIGDEQGWEETAATKWAGF